MDAYRGFAGVYDLLMDDFDYPAWAEYYLRLIADAGVRPTEICDCACGTGSLTTEFAARGLRVTGADIAQEMLDVAREKAMRRGFPVRFVCMDMTKLTLPHPVDAIICGCDGVNYLTSEKRVRAFFEAAHANLRPGGALAFDVSSPYKLKEVLGDAFFGEERDEAAYLWQNTLEGDVVTMDLTFFIRRADGLYERVTETHRQKAHEPETIARLLNETGFTGVRICGDRTFDPPKPDEMRLHFCAVRE